MCSALRKSGIPLEVLQRSTISWSEQHSKELATYVAPSGEIRTSTPDKPSQSFRFYFAALLRLGLAHELSGLVTNSRFGAVLKHLNKQGDWRPSNPFSLTQSERALFLFVLVEHDADYLFTVLGQVAKGHGCTLEQCQSDFQQAYLDRLDSRLSRIGSDRTLREIRDARQRVLEWKSPKRYSEDIVPTRLNWLIDLGIVSAAKDSGRYATYHLSPNGAALHAILKTAGVYIDSEAGWTGSGFVEACVALLGINATPWAALNAERQVELFSECLEACQKHFGSSLLPRLPADQTFLFSVIYLLTKRAIGVEMATLETWVGYERVVNGLSIGYRKSARSNESYVAIRHA